MPKSGFLLLALPLCVALLDGCTSPVARPTGSAESSVVVTGSVHGGQQPVSGATIQLYTVGTSGDGSAATALLTSTVTTNANGGFVLTGLYSCSSATEVYLTATGGNPGLAGSNADLALMAALGPCSSLTSGTTISVNEVTTVAAVAALAPYMSSATAIGSGSSDASALAAAFTLAGEFVNTASGSAPGSNVPTGVVVPVALINTLGDIISSCVNSTGGAAGSATNCGSLFTLTTPANGSAPSDTIAALLNLANNPALNTASLFGLTPAQAPFQPQLTAPPSDFSVKLGAVAGTAALTLSSNGLSFPVTAVGFSAQPLSITMTNNGSTTVTLNSISITGVNGADYAETNTCGSSLAATTNCTISVSLTPAATGSRNAAVVISSSAPTSPQTVALAGVGGAPSAGPVTLSVSSLNYDTTYTWQDFNVQNYGNTPLTIRSITSNSSNFAVANNGCGTYLAAQSVCTVSVSSTGRPLSEGGSYTYTGTVTIDDDAFAGPQTLALSSTNTAFVSLSGPYGLSGAYGAWPVGSTETGVSLEGYSAIPNASPSISVSVAGTNAGDFSVSPSSCTVNGETGANCGFNVTFHPSGTGLRTAKLMINDVGYVPVSGTGDAPGPSFVTTYTSSTYAPGQAFLGPNGTASDTDTYTILNNGTTTLSLALTLSGPNAANFSATGTNCGSLTGSCTVAVAFSSTNVGTYTASLLIKDTASSYSQTLPLSFHASYPLLTPNPSQLSFANQAVGSSSDSQSFMVQNGNVGGIIGESVNLTPSTTGNFTVTSPLTCPASTTQACTFSVAFTPKSAGSFNEALTFTAPVSGNTGQIQLAGAGGAPVVSLSSNSLTFPARTNGTTSVPMPVTVTNTGNLPLVVSAVNIVGAVNANFTQTNNCSTVAVNASCTINVTFAPTVTGSQSASIQILSNAASSPDVVSLSGVSN